MRLPALLLLLLLSAAALPGCLDQGGDPDPADDEPDTPMEETGSMEDLHFEGDVPVGADPFNTIPVGTPAGGIAPCSSPASTCFLHDFTVPAGTNASLTATLAWQLPANDFDLYLYQGDEALSQDGINSIPPAAEVPPTEQVLRHGGLGPGEYTFWVVAWLSVADGYTLDVTFET